MSDMAQTIIPKSDQLNADDLIAGTKTITITGVTIRGGQEQPIAISYEGDEGKPYKACKSMCRVMVTAWGADSKQYVGRSMTLYRDPAVKWGGMEVGGIRISHMSDIESKITLALTMSKSNRKPYIVQPLRAAGATNSSRPDASGAEAGKGGPSWGGNSPATDYLTPDQQLEIADECRKLGANTLPALLAAAGRKLGREVGSIAMMPADQHQNCKDFIAAAIEKRKAA